ncbi:nicotinamide riboside transporter PnuC [Sphingobacterium sp. MYb382]|uniref:nicotinamide riboside transporter PnuC n=1 Tax=Sphingobacterium sp. MYb382 TaxID=2745278 RepID=UPI0030AF5BF5
MPDFFTNFYTQFSQTSLLEWAATLSGFFCVYLAAKEHILNWPISIISVSIYGYIFYHSRLYGDAVLQIYFLGTAIYGWYYWSRMHDQTEVPIRRFSRRQMLFTFLAILGLGLLLGGLLSYFTDSDVPYVDGFCTATSFVAQFLMTRKIIQNWLLWVAVDICYIPLYIHKNLLLTAVLYLAFAIIAWNGYRGWHKTYRGYHLKEN